MTQKTLQPRPLTLSTFELPEGVTSRPWDYLPATAPEHARDLARREIEALAKTDGTVALCAGKACASLTPLPWDSGIFGLPMARIGGVYLSPGNAGLHESRALFSALLTAASDAGIQHIDLPLRVTDIAAIEAATALGFRVVACNLGMDWEVRRARTPPPASAVRVRCAREDEVAALGDLAAASIDTLSRFAADAYLPPQKVPDLFRAWAMNSLRGRADRVQFAELDGKLAGYCTWRLQPDYEAVTGAKLASLELTAVHPDARRHGVLMALVHDGLTWLEGRGVQLAEVFTHALNGGMQRGCSRMGAVTRTARYSLHWSADQASRR